jgi:ubiquitin-activating enzyme E1
MSKLVEHISKKPIPKHQKFVIFEITAEDVTEEDGKWTRILLQYRSSTC